MESLAGVLHSLGFSYQQIGDFRKAGFRTTSDVVSCDPEQASQKAALPYVVFERIRKRILEHVQPGVPADILFLALSSRRLPFQFGITTMDETFPDILSSGKVIEVCGAPLSGKSDLCCGICLEAAFANRPSLYIDTSGQFGAERLKGIMQRWGCRGPQIMDTLERIYVLRVTEVFRLLQLLDFLLSWKVDQKDPTGRKPEIVIIDSVYSVLGPWMGGRIDQGYSLMNQLAFALKNVAITLDIPVIYTNQMPTVRSGAVQEANLGTFWQSVPHERIGLQNVEKPNEPESGSETPKKGKRLRRAVLTKSADQVLYGMSERKWW